MLPVVMLVGDACVVFRAVPERVPFFRVGSCFEQSFVRDCVAVYGGEHERRVPFGIGVVDSRKFREPFHFVDVAVHYGGHERGFFHAYLMSATSFFCASVHSARNFTRASLASQISFSSVVRATDTVLTRSFGSMMSGLNITKSSSSSSSMTRKYWTACQRYSSGIHPSSAYRTNALASGVLISTALRHFPSSDSTRPSGDIPSQSHPSFLTMPTSVIS